ncbi:hypothetical protein FRC02_009705 [Tulasnella sp. 418]|nr:hypothetical protein FRC02_009705 [Tulasnella sp. 418]
MCITLFGHPRSGASRQLLSLIPDTHSYLQSSLSLLRRVGATVLMSPLCICPDFTGHPGLHLSAGLFYSTIRGIMLVQFSNISATEQVFQSAVDYLLKMA